MARRETEGASLDMTPMIDVVFQLIIFFIVTYKIEDRINEDVRLEPAKHGPAIEKKDPRALTIEVDKRGWVSIHGAQLTLRKLKEILKTRYNHYGEFPVMIRGDARAMHRDIKSVMDVCTESGIWRINFVAVKEKKSRT
jgi:biopolymer transport protein ExbD